MRSIPPIRPVLMRWQSWALIAVGASLIVALLLPIALLPLLSWDILRLSAVTTDTGFARSLALYLPLSIGLAGATWQTQVQKEGASCAS